MLENAKISGFADEINHDLDVQTGLLKELGIEYLELRSALSKGIAAFTPAEASALKKTLMERGLKVSAIGSPIGKIGIKDAFEPHFEMFKNVVEIAKIMETPYIRMFSFFIPEGEAPEGYREEVFLRLKIMIDYAAKEKVVLLHENEKGIYGDNASRCKELFEGLYGDNFKCTFDFANFVQCQQDTEAAYEALEPYIAYIHIKDAMLHTGEVTLPGHGEGKLGTILEKLNQKGFDGFLSLEPHLTDFAALKGLEKNAAIRNRTDGEAAFAAAYDALRELLK